MNGSQWVALCFLGLLWAATPGVVVARNFAASGGRQGRSTRGVRTLTFVRGVNDTDANRAAQPVARAVASPRVQYSEYARKGQFPYIGALFNSNGRNFCTATLIRPQVLLTAAHCVWDRQSRTFDPPAYVRVGLNDASPDASAEEAGELRNWSRIELPEEFRSTPDEERQRWDIALIILDTPVTFVKPVQLAGEDQRIGAWRALAVTGFGYYDPSKPTEVSAQLRVGTVAYLTPSVCAKYSTLGAPPENNICAGLVPTATDACPGDSGGPLVIWTPEANKHIQVGIVTWGPKCFNDTSSFYPIGYYSSVGAWSPWINEQLFNYGFL